MKLRYILAAGALALTSATQAQTWIPDTVSMGVNYADNIYYSLQNGQSGPAVTETNWHVAVQAISFSVPFHGGAGIWTNEARKNGPSVKLYTLDKGSASFMTITAADTVGKTGAAHALHNDTSSYSKGAFNAPAVASNPFNYGWGNYYMSGAPAGYPDHSLVGDTLFLLNFETSSMGGPATVSKSYIFWPRALVGGNQWTMYYRELGSTDVDTINISTTGSNTLFKYYNIETKTVLDREPARTSWDFVFTNYMDLYGTSGLQGVTGALQNYNVSVAQVNNVVPNSADYTTIVASSYDSSLNTIGNDWKYLDGMAWALTANRSYFVKVLNGDIWQVYFDYFAKQDVTNFRRIGLQKRKVYTVPPAGVTELNAFVSNVLVVPNPAANGNTNLLIDAKQELKNAQITIVDLNGRVVMKAQQNIKAGFQQLPLDISKYPTGVYMINLSGAGFSATQKMVVK